MDENELVLTINLIELFLQNQLNLSVSSIAKKMNKSSDFVSNSLNGLLNKSFVTVNIEYTKSMKVKEIFCLDELFTSLEKILTKEVKDEMVLVNDNEINKIITLTENAFNKEASPYELDIILNWVENKVSIDKIKQCIDIAKSKKVCNVRYVDRIIANIGNEVVYDENKSKVLDDVFRNLK